jgi:hypothetical protein
LSRAGPAGRDAVSWDGDGREARLRTSFFRTAFFLMARRVDALAVLAPTTARLRPFVLDFALFWTPRLTFRRTRFAMAKIPFKCLTGFR